MSPSEFFITESLRLARQMNLPDARLYLRGLLELAGNHDQAAPIRKATILLDESDRQLELLTQPAAQPKPHDGDGHNS